jgi:hypothetical protein
VYSVVPSPTGQREKKAMTDLEYDVSLGHTLWCSLYVRTLWSTVYSYISFRTAHGEGIQYIHKYSIYRNCKSEIMPWTVLAGGKVVLSVLATAVLTFLTISLFHSEFCFETILKYGIGCIIYCTHDYIAYFLIYCKTNQSCISLFRTNHSRISSYILD